MFLQRLVDVFLLLFFLFVGEFLRFRFDFGGLLPVGIRVKRNQALVGRAPVLPVIRRLDHGAQPVVIGLRNRIIAMIVALGATDRQYEQRRRDDLDRVGHHLVAHRFLVDRRRGGAVRAHAEKARGDQQFARLRIANQGLRVGLSGAREFIAGKLLGDKPVERFVGV